MKYLTIGYGDQAGYDRTPRELRDAAHEHDAEQAAAGVIAGVLLEPVQGVRVMIDPDGHPFCLC